MEIVNEQKMSISKTTRTHLIYQFIILTLLLLGIGYNEFLLDRKILICMAFLPIFCYQLLILSCCMGLMPVPLWMGFLQPDASKKYSTKEDKIENDFELSATMDEPPNGFQRMSSFPEVNEMSSYQRRWEKSVLNLGASPRCFSCPQKSKSWMNLSDSKSTERLSREDSLDVLSALSERKSSARTDKREDKARKREERATKARSWKPDIIDFDVPEETEFTKCKNLSMKERAELPSLRCAEIQEESDLTKSYSFPFRQKRLETWLEMKETNVADTNASPGMPYWKTVGYNLAVKYEARRRRRAISNPARTDVPNDLVHDFQKSTEITPESASTDERPNTNIKKSTKSASACINKLKLGFSNLISKKRDEGSERAGSGNFNRVSKSALFKLKTRNTSGQTKEKDKVSGMPEFPQFLSNDRPLIFYPKYIPFEKERFESDVEKKMVELAEEQRQLAEK